MAAVCELDSARRKVAKDDFPRVETFAQVGDMLKNAELVGYDYYPTQYPCAACH